MNKPSQNQMTRLLAEATRGEKQAAGQLLPLVYSELRNLAERRMAHERMGHTLQATDLVHEVYVRLVGDQDPSWANRAHFFSAAADAMRRILIDHARKRGRIKRGGGRRRVTISVADLAESQDSGEILNLDEAIRRLEEWDGEMGQVVRLRFFAGLSVEETAQALGISTATVKREWTVARAWLYRELERT